MVHHFLETSKRNFRLAKKKKHRLGLEICVLDDDMAVSLVFGEMFHLWSIWDQLMVTCFYGFIFRHSDLNYHVVFLISIAITHYTFVVILYC